MLRMTVQNFDKLVYTLKAFEEITGRKKKKQEKRKKNIT